MRAKDGYSHITEVLQALGLDLTRQGASLPWRAGRLECAATIGLVSVGLGGVAGRADGDVEIGGLVGL